MTEPVRIALTNEASAASLADELPGRFEARVRRDGERWEVVVPVDAYADLVGLLKALESWLQESGLSRVRLSVDGTAYCMEPIREPTTGT
jgi:hypothetical protein